MRIGIDGRLWNETGVGRYIRSLFKYLQKVDRENEYVWFFRKAEFSSVEMPNEKWQKRLADVRWHTLAEQIFLPKILSTEKLDLVHFPYFSIPVFYKGRFVVTIHDLIFDHYKTGKASTLPFWIYWIKTIGYKVVLSQAVKKSSAIITVSNDAKNEIINHYNVNSKKIFVTYEAGNLEENQKKTGDTEDIKKITPYILYVGNAHPHKNVENLVLAMKYIAKRDNRLKLVLIGRDDFFYKNVGKMIKREGLEDRIILIGKILNNNLAAYYKNAEAFVTASKMEGFGIPPLEAMSVGCPVIVSDIPVFHEIYQDSAVYFNQNKAEEIANIIINVINDKSMVDRLIKKGFERVNSFDWKRTAKETASVYNIAYESGARLRPYK